MLYFINDKSILGYFDLEEFERISLLKENLILGQVQDFRIAGNNVLATELYGGVKKLNLVSIKLQTEIQLKSSNSTFYTGISEIVDQRFLVVSWIKDSEETNLFLMDDNLKQIGDPFIIIEQKYFIHNITLRKVSSILFGLALVDYDYFHLLVVTQNEINGVKLNLKVTSGVKDEWLGGFIVLEKQSTHNKLEMLVFGSNNLNRKLTLKVPEIK